MCSSSHSLSVPGELTSDLTRLLVKPAGNPVCGAISAALLGPLDTNWTEGVRPSYSKTMSYKNPRDRGDFMMAFSYPPPITNRLACNKTDIRF